MSVQVGDLVFVNDYPFQIANVRDEGIYIYSETSPGNLSLIVQNDLGQWQVHRYDEPHTIRFQKQVGYEPGQLQLQVIFPDIPVCLMQKEANTEIWRILNVSEVALNHLRNWLERKLVSVSINWVVIDANTSIFKNEPLAERIGLIPILFNPMFLEDFSGDLGFDECSEETCLVFEVEKDNQTSEVIDVLTTDLRWIPLGDQQERFPQAPRALYPDQVITKLRPGDRIRLRAYAIRGTGEENAKWSSVYSHYRFIPTHSGRRTPVRTRILENVTEDSTCLRCDQISLDVLCTHFAIELTGGIGFNEIQEQLETRFEWKDFSPTEPVSYILPPIIGGNS